jgi:hypothetical protein
MSSAWLDAFATAGREEDFGMLHEMVCLDPVGMLTELGGLKRSADYVSDEERPAQRRRL